MWSLIAEATGNAHSTTYAWYRRATMIPYDDLVAALSAWRARQGLPVSTLGGGSAAPQPGSGPHAQPGSGPYGQPGSGPYGQPGSGPYAAQSPSGSYAAQSPSGSYETQTPSGAYAAQSPSGSYPAQSGSGPTRTPPPPPPRPGTEDAMQVDDAEMIEEHYENQGSDYAMTFGNSDDQTSIGEAPERPTDPSDWNGGRGGRGDW